MNLTGDYEDEMPHEDFTDDPGVAAFIAGVRAAGNRMPTPSPALAHLLAHGVSSSQPKSRSIIMKVKGYIAGLGIAAKVMLGAGVAAAATTGAGAAGVLPEPVQHAFAATVETVTPFAMPDPADHHVNSDEHHEPSHDAPGVTDEPVVTTTTTAATQVETHTTEPPHSTDNSGTDEHHGDTTPTTLVTPTTEVHHEQPHPTTTTTVVEHHDGDNNNPESISLQCYASPEPNRISCRWTASSDPAHRRYALLRTNNQNSEGRVVWQTETGLEYSDTSVVSGVTYTYRVVSLREDGSTESHSNGQTFACCAFATESS